MYILILFQLISRRYKVYTVRSLSHLVLLFLPLYSHFNGRTRFNGLANVYFKTFGYMPLIVSSAAFLTSP